MECGERVCVDHGGIMSMWEKGDAGEIVAGHRQKWDSDRATCSPAGGVVLLQLVRIVWGWCPSGEAESGRVIDEAEVLKDVVL